MTDRIRTTISVTPEVHAVFKRMAEAGNMSASRVMGEWLGDTVEAAEMIVLKMEEAKRAPLAVMRELQAMVAGLSSGVDADMEKVRQLAAGGVRGAGRRTAAAVIPPSSNTGGKSPVKGKEKGRTL